MDPHKLPLKLIEWRRDCRNTRRGFATVELATSHGPLEIRDIVVSQNHEARFVGMPAGSYIVDGRAQYATILKWDSIARFRADLIELVERVDPQAFDEPTEVPGPKSQGVAA